MEYESTLFELPSNPESKVLLLSNELLTYYATQFSEKYSEKKIIDFLRFYKVALTNAEHSVVAEKDRTYNFDNISGVPVLFDAIRDVVDDDIKLDEFQMFLLFDIIIQMIIILQLAFMFKHNNNDTALLERLRVWDNQFRQSATDTYSRWLNDNIRDAKQMSDMNENKFYDEDEFLMPQFIKKLYNITLPSHYEEAETGGARGVQLHRRAQVAEENRRNQLNRGQRQIEDERNIEPFDKLYDAILDEANFERNDINRELLKKKLNAKPLKSKWMIFENGYYWQADTKVFGRDIISNGELGLLVCVDASTRRCDAEPVLNVAQFDCIPAFYQILDRHIIQQGMPKIVMTDQGGEFGQRFTNYLNKLGIKHRVSFAGRKEQTSIAEHTIGLITFGLMANLYRLRVHGRNPSQQPKHVSAVDFLADGILPRVINKINAWSSQKYPKPASQWYNLDYGESGTDLREGDLVLVRNIKTERIRKRNGQHDYTRQPYQVVKVYTPTIKGEPYRFLTTYSQGKPPVTFKRDELLKYANYEHNHPIIEFD